MAYNLSRAIKVAKKKVTDGDVRGLNAHRMSQNIDITTLNVTIPLKPNSSYF
jgi:hypothetical protein